MSKIITAKKKNEHQFQYLNIILLTVYSNIDAEHNFSLYKQHIKYLNYIFK